jgi:hypothetical protein
MQPADFRVEPWVWIPLSRRRGRVLPTVLVAAVAATAGYMMGHKAEVVPPQKTVAANPTTQPAAANSEAKPREAGKKPDLALKSDGETEKQIPAVAQTKPEVPAIVLLNPGTADPRANRAPISENRAPTRATGDEVARSNKPRGEGAAASRNPMRDYQDLRDYMLSR